MHRYWAFGLGIASDVRMDELAVDPDPKEIPDLTIRREDISDTVPAVGEAALHFVYDKPDGVEMVFPGVAAIRIAGPDRIVITPHADAPANYLPFPLLGPAMGWVLHLRRLFVLHASAVAFGGKSFGFLGDKMAGKSTTAAAFLRAGGSLLTDDLMAIDTQKANGLVVQPAFAQLKLSKEAGESVVVPGAKSLPLIMKGFPKHQFRLNTMHDRATGCDALFVLQRGSDEPRVEWMEGAASLTSLMRYSYSVRFSQAPVEMQDRKRYFEQGARIARDVRIGTLHVPAALDRLQEVVDYVAEQLEAEPL